MTINRNFFFDRALAYLFDGRGSSSQRAGLQAILDCWEGSFAKLDDRWLAYMLATAHHETGRLMIPVRETFANSDAEAISRLNRAYAAGKLPWVRTPYWQVDADGKSWFGRGLVQITHKSNYERLGRAIGVDLVANPSFALDQGVAVRILFAGMMNGLFTGKSLAHFFAGNKEDWRGARKIINGIERQDLVASYAKAYYSCISYTTG